MKQFTQAFKNLSKKLKVTVIMLYALSIILIFSSSTDNIFIAIAMALVPTCTILLKTEYIKNSKRKKNNLILSSAIGIFVFGSFFVVILNSPANDNLQKTVQNNTSSDTTSSKITNSNSSSLKETNTSSNIASKASSSSTASSTPRSSSSIYSSKETVAQRNAVSTAKDYIAYAAFSYKGLIKQLEFEKFSSEEAVYGVNKCGADWYEQAVRAAKEYLYYMPFSRQGLIDQLQYEGFTYDQALHGVTANGF